MNSSFFYLGLAVIVVAGVIWTTIWGGNVPKTYRERSCMGKKWMNQFPNVSKDDIRTYLEIFINSFSFDSKHKLMFNPDDKVMDVYRAVYPSKGWPDGLELESFAISLEKKYSVNFSDLWNEQLTIGELFRHCTAGQTNVTAGRSI
jgi:hypothetical protein